MFVGGGNTLTNKEEGIASKWHFLYRSNFECQEGTWPQQETCSCTHGQICKMFSLRIKIKAVIGVVNVDQGFHQSLSYL